MERVLEDEDFFLISSDTSLLISREELQLILNIMCETSTDRMNNVGETEPLWPAVPIQLIYRISEKLNMPESVKFQAEKIFLRYISEELDVIFREQKNVSDQCYVLKIFVKNILLYILISLSIASKYFSQTYLKLSEVSDLLRAFTGLDVDVTEIQGWERRIVRLLELDVFSETTLCYLERLLFFLTMNFPTTNFDSLKEKSVKLLSYMSIHREKVYDTLFMILYLNGAEKRAKLKSDSMLFACGIMLGASHMWDCNSMDGREIRAHLQHMLKLPKYVLCAFTHAIIETYGQLYSENHPTTNGR